MFALFAFLPQLMSRHFYFVQSGVVARDFVVMHLSDVVDTQAALVLVEFEQGHYSLNQARNNQCVSFPWAQGVAS